MDFFVRGKHNGMTNLQLNKSDCVNQKMTETAAMSITFILNCQFFFLKKIQSIVPTFLVVSCADYFCS